MEWGDGFTESSKIPCMYMFTITRLYGSNGNASGNLNPRRRVVTLDQSMISNNKVDQTNID